MNEKFQPQSIKNLFDNARQNVYNHTGRGKNDLEQDFEDNADSELEQELAGSASIEHPIHEDNIFIRSIGRSTVFEPVQWHTAYLNGVLAS